MVYVAELLHPAILDRFDDLGAGLVNPSGQYFAVEGVPLDGSGLEFAGVLYGEWWRLITSAFLHELPGKDGFGLTHILFNMVWLAILGGFLEQQLGRLRFVALYLLSALGGSVLVVLIDPYQSAIGASGAGFGLAAAYFVLTRKLHVYPIDRYRLLFSFVLWLVLAAGFTSWSGHLGGLLTGGVVAIGLAYAPRHHREATQAAVMVAAATLLIAAIVAKATGVAG